MIQSFEKYWHPQYSLIVYNENFRPNEKCVYNMGWNLGSDYDNFQNTVSNSREKTFAKKGFSIIHAMENIDCDRLVWLDADLIITNKIKTNFFDKLMPEDKLSLHFGVWHIKENIEYFSCETGFFILNKRHSHFTKFLETYKNIYLQRDRANMRRFYDGEIYGKTVQKLDEQFMLDLNANKKYKTPIGKSEMKHYISHLKAGLKDRVNEV